MQPLTQLRKFLPLVLTIVFLGCGSSPAEPDSDVGTATEDLCSNAGMTSNFADFKASVGQTVTFTGSASCQMANPQYEFWVQAPGTAAVLAQGWSTSPTYTWNTTGLATGVYNWQVWVKEAGSPKTWETHYGRGFTLSSSPCSTATSTTSPSGTATVGTPVTITTTAGCGGTSVPEFEVWHQAPGGSMTIVQPWSASATYNWVTTSEPVGTHLFQVWVRAQGSANTVDTHTSFGYVLTAVACTAVSAVASPPSPAKVGTLVTFTASSASCTTPEYRFLVAPGGGTKTLARDWGTSPDFNWDTTGLAATVYQIQVIARPSGSTSAGTSAFLNYTLTTGNTGAVSTISSGGRHTCVLKTAGTVDCWGYNPDGELGNGSTTGSASPVAVSGLTGGVALGSGYYHTCAIRSGGAVSCWGLNSNGQLGNGSTTSSSTPVSVSGLSGAVAIAGGAGHTCAVLSDGTVRCWGYNSRGQLGNGLMANSATPVVVSGVTGATAIAAGYYHTCVRVSGGTVRCWGDNSNGELGNGTTTASLTPVTATGVSNVTQLVAADGHTCALIGDGTVKCWGFNANGQLGNGSTSNSSTAVMATGISTATWVTTNAYNTCAVLGDGTEKCWGLNGYGEVGDGTTTQATSPVAVAMLTGTVTRASAGFYFSCALMTDDSMQCWGHGLLGELGNGSSKNSSVPVTVAALP